MADLYVNDTLYARYVAEYGEDAKDEMRDAIEAGAPGGSDE